MVSHRLGCDPSSGPIVGSLWRWLPSLALGFFLFFQGLIENIFVGFVVMGVAMTTATALQKNIQEGLNCHSGHLSLPWQSL